MNLTFGMYRGLFLAPWMLMYALSPMAIDHRTLFLKDAGFQKESEQTYTGVIAAGAILNHLKLEGTHTVTAGPGGARITTSSASPCCSGSPPGFTCGGTSAGTGPGDRWRWRPAPFLLPFS